MKTVTLQPSGLTFQVEPGETILQAAIRQNVNFPWRCKQGICTSCVCKCISGEIDYGERDKASLLTQADDGEEYVYACIGCPLTDMTLHHPFIK